MNNQVSENPVKNRKYSFNLIVISCLLVALYLVSNILAVRIIRVGNLSVFDGGTITFPFAYMLGDALTEVWGFKTSKKVIWLTFACNILLVFFTGIGIYLPYPEFQEETVMAYNTIFTYVPRIVLASLVAFLAGEITNAWSLEKIKALTGEKHLWVRTIGSSAVGYLFDTVIFVLIAFVGTAPAKDLGYMILMQYIIKIVLEAITGTPLAYGLIKWLKRRELDE